jgi:hypothetical protein
MSNYTDLKNAAERLLKLKAEDCESADQHMKYLTLCNMSFQEQSGPAVVLELLAELERLKKFEDWFTRLETATNVIGESFRDERDLALFSVYWAARLYMCPSEVVESDDEQWIERTIRSGAETLMVGGRRLRDEAPKDEKGKPIIPFDWQYKSPRESHP